MFIFIELRFDLSILNDKRYTSHLIVLGMDKWTSQCIPLGFLQSRLSCTSLNLLTLLLEFGG